MSRPPRAHSVARSLPPSRLDRFGPGMLAALALVTRAWLWTRTAGLTMDSPLYVRMAEALALGERWPSPAHHGYPVLVAIASIAVPGRELPGRLVSLAASLALPLLVWAIARRRVGSAAALFAGALVAVHPLLTVYGVAIMTEASFLALAFTGLLLLEHERPLAAGVGLGLAYAVRPEAAVIAPVAALLTRSRRQGPRVVLGAVLAALPFVALTSWEHGRFSFTPKTVLVRPAFTNAAEAEWRLADSSHALPDGAGLDARLRTSAPAMLASYAPQFVKHARRLVEAWPLPLLVLSLSGLFAGVRPWLAPLACLLVVPLLAAPDDVRFAQLFVPTLALLAAQGVARFAVPRGRGAITTAALLALAGIAMTWAGPAGTRAREFDDGPMPTLRAAGAWLGEHAAPGDVVMDRKAYVPFFAHLEHVQLPDDALPEIVTYAQRRGVRWLVVEEYVAGSLRPQLQPLIADPAYTTRGEPRLALAYATRTLPGTGVAVFAVRPAAAADSAAAR